MPAATALRKLIDDPRASLTRVFNLSGGFADAGNAIFSSASSANAASNAGQISAVGLRPISVEEKLEMLKRMIANGKVSVAPGVSLDRIKDEMKKPENDGLSVNELTAVLASKRMLRVTPAPRAQLKVAAPTLAPRPSF